MALSSAAGGAWWPVALYVIALGLITITAGWKAPETAKKALSA